MTGTDGQCVLVVTAHPDDECLGAGGTIAAHVDRGVVVDVVCLTGSPERNRELREACRRLGVRSVRVSERGDFDLGPSLIPEVVSALLEMRPAAVITHSEVDYNRAHVECARIVSEAAEWAAHVTVHGESAHRVQHIYEMEVNSMFSCPHVLVDTTDSFERALSALTAHRSQLEKAGGYYRRLFDAKTRLRGVQAACERAEAFMVRRLGHAGPFYAENSVGLLV